MVCYVKFRILVGKQWDLETWDGDTWFNYLKSLIYPGSSEPTSPPEPLTHLSCLRWRRAPSTVGYHNFLPSQYRCLLPIRPMIRVKLQHSLMKIC